MQYLALIYADEEQWSALSSNEKEAMYDRYRAVASEARAAATWSAARRALRLTANEAESRYLERRLAEVS
jgi:hypothetical protein